MLSELKPVYIDDLVRYGNDYDGGYVFSLSSLKDCNYFISAGLSFDWEFEIQLKERHPALLIDCFDRTTGFNYRFLQHISINILKIITYLFFPKKVQDNPRTSYRKILRVLNMNKIFSGNLKFTKKHISNYDSSDVQNLEILLLKSEHIGIKIDTEGEEYNLLSIMKKFINNIELLIIEFHNVENNYQEIVAFIKAISPTHTIHHIHGNNSSNINKLNIPDVIEITIGKNKQYSTDGNKVREYPIKNLDFPNSRKKKDFSFKFK